MFFFFNNDPVTNHPNSTKLQYIKINGLFNRSNITLTFDDEVNIYIGENGLGKTTVLNCVYYILKKRTSKLSDIIFDDICVKFKNIDKEYVVTDADVRDYNNKRSRRSRIYSETEIIQNMLDDIAANWAKEFIDQETFELAIHKIAH